MVVDYYYSSSSIGKNTERESEMRERWFRSKRNANNILIWKSYYFHSYSAMLHDDLNRLFLGHHLKIISTKS